MCASLLITQIQLERLQRRATVVVTSSKGSLQAGSRWEVGGKDEFHLESLLFCSIVFPYKPKMLMVGENLQELKVLSDS